MTSSRAKAVSSEVETAATPTAPARGPAPKAIPFDLGVMDVQKASAQGAWMEILHPSSGEKTGLFILIVGADSQEYRDSQRRLIDLSQKDGRKGADASIYERRGAEFAASITMTWKWGDREGVLPFNGTELPFTDENAVNLYLDRRWIREQVERFAGDRINFFPD